MALIHIVNRTTKKSGTIKLRFRIRDNGSIELSYSSNIEANLSDLAKFQRAESMKNRANGAKARSAKIDQSDNKNEQCCEIIVTPLVPNMRANYNRQLVSDVNALVKILNDVYEEGRKSGAITKLTKSSKFKELVDKVLYPEAVEQTIEAVEARYLLNRFKKYIDEGLFSEARRRAYEVTYRILERYLVISDQQEIEIDEVTADFLISFRTFLVNEWKYASMKKWAFLYADVTKQNIPTTPRAQNTVAVKLKGLQAFMRVLEDADEIVKSPFRKLGREVRRTALKEQYADPISLTADEVKLILNTDVNGGLKTAKDAFVVLCALGCRISDFKTMTMNNVAVSADGIPYIHYLPKKTMNVNKTLDEIKTPLMRFAFELIQRYGFNFPVLRNVSGRDGFNVKIKEVLEACGINREVCVFNEVSKEMEYKPLYEQGSTKLCRKSFVDITTKYQVNKYATGLHKNGSDAVNHYTKLELSDLNTLMCAAFDEEPFKVNKQLQVLD